METKHETDADRTGLRITTFGAFSVVCSRPGGGNASDPGTISGAPDKVQGRGTVLALTMLKILLCQSSRLASKDLLMELILPDHPRSKAQARMDDISSVLRMLLRSMSGNSENFVHYIHSSKDSGNGYQLAQYPLVWVDADAFLWNVEQAARMERFGDDPLPYWERAYALASRGAFLAGEPYSEWASERRELLSGHYRQCVNQLARLYRERGGQTQAEQVLRAYVLSHRSDEDALRPLMELLGTQERYQEALEHYEHTKQALALDGYEPDARTWDIAEYVRTKQIKRERAIASPFVRDTESGETVDRREAAKIISTFSLSLLVAPMALEQFLENVAPFDTATKTFIDMRTVNGLGTITESHWQLVYGGVPKRDLLFGVQGHLQSVIRFLQSSPLTAIEQHLCSIASQQAQIMSEIYFDMHDYRRAEVFSKLAIEAAQKANNSALYAVALARMSFLYTYIHQFKEALSILQVARRYAEESTEITVCCWIAAMEAEVQANIFAYYNEIKASDACLSALERAECITERVVNDAYWTKFGPASLAGYKGVCFKQLHKPLQAQIVLIEALNTISKDVPGGQATALTDLAGAYAQQGEIEEACNRAMQALKIIAEQNKSVNTLQRVCDFRLDLERWASSSQVKNLDEQIAMTRIHIM